MVYLLPSTVCYYSLPKIPILQVLFVLYEGQDSLRLNELSIPRENMFHLAVSLLLLNAFVLPSLDQWLLFLCWYTWYQSKLLICRNKMMPHLDQHFILLKIMIQNLGRQLMYQRSDLCNGKYHLFNSASVYWIGFLKAIN